MDLQWHDEDSEARFLGLCRDPFRLPWPRRPGGAVALLLHGAAVGGRAQVGRAHGGAVTPGSNLGGTSVPAAFCWAVALGS